MTLHEIKSSLFAFFSSNDTFTMDEKSDFEKVCFLSLNTPLDIAMIRAALKEYETQGIITNVSYIEQDGNKLKECWVLNKPIQQYSQSLELTYPTLDAMTKLINQYCSQANNPQSVVDPLSIQEKDIQSLIVITHQVLNPNEEK